MVPHVTTIRRHGPGEWANWSENLCGWARDQVTFDAPAEGLDGLAWCEAAGRAWRTLLGEAARTERDLRPVGAAWSFTGILETDGVLAHTAGLDGVFAVDPGWLTPRPPGDEEGALVLVGGGVTVKRLNAWLAANDLSLSVSGASNGQTIAGAIATGTHGSTPAHAGMAEQVVGLHLIGGPDVARCWWLERDAGAPGARRLTPDAVARLGVDPDAVPPPHAFDAALVHLGGLGVVNAVLLRVVKRRPLRVIKTKAAVDAGALAMLADGRFHEFARAVAPDAPPFGPPHFVQAILNPFDLFGQVALVALLFDEPSFLPPVISDPLASLEPLELVGEFTRRHPDKRGAAVTAMMKHLYPEVPRRPDDTAYKHWDELMADPVHDRMGRLYTAAVAFPRPDLPRALEVMRDAFDRHGGGDLVFTLRFVRGGEGLLAFTRWPDTVVIDMDGIHTQASRIAGDRVFDALRASGIPFSFHWGKIGEIDPAKVEGDYGPSADPASPLARWKAARAALLDPALHGGFGGAALREWGLA